MADQPVVQCATCGVERRMPLPEVCPICADERQYLPRDGVQRWTSAGDGQFPHARLTAAEVEPGVQLFTHHDCPGIGHSPLLVRTTSGNFFIEPPAHLDDAAVDLVRSLGGLAGIVASHPHMYGVQAAWSAAFDDCPVHISEADREWLGVEPAHLVVWEGELELADDLHASQPGGHFPGSAVLHWRAPDGRGVLFAGDTIMPVASAGWVTFMRSYPNQIPLSPAVVARVTEHVGRYDFDRLYGNFGGHLDHGAAAGVRRSADRYIAWASGRNDHLT